MLIGITGGSCTGKSTLVTLLEQSLGGNCTVLSFDDYFIGLEQLKDEIDDWKTPELYRYDDYIRDVQKLSRGESITIKTESRECMKSGIKSKTITPNNYVL